MKVSRDLTPGVHVYQLVYVDRHSFAMYNLGYIRASQLHVRQLVGLVISILVSEISVEYSHDP